MRCLLDTHVVLWIAADDPRLSETAKSLFLDNKNNFYFSIGSLWELAIKVSLKKLVLDDPLDLFVYQHVIGNDIDILPIETKHILPLETLPYYHKDPFDRLILAQAMVEKIPIISKDQWFDLYPIQRIWQSTDSSA